MVDVANRDWRDNNSLLSKVTLERKILHALNEKLGYQRTYSQYLSRLKWFKQRYNNYCNILRSSSGFGWDPITKKISTPNEVWEDYFKVILFLFCLIYFHNIRYCMCVSYTDILFYLLFLTSLILTIKLSHGYFRRL